MFLEREELKIRGTLDTIKDTNGLYLLVEVSLCETAEKMAY